VDIWLNAHRLNKRQMPEPPKAEEDGDFYFVDIADPEEGVPKIIQMIKERMPRRFGLGPDHAGDRFRRLSEPRSGLPAALTSSTAPS